MILKLWLKLVNGLLLLIVFIENFYFVSYISFKLFNIIIIFIIFKYFFFLVIRYFEELEIILFEKNLKEISFSFLKCLVNF